FATVEVCAFVELGDDGRCREARLAAGATADRPLDLSAALDALSGEEPERAAEQAARAASRLAEVGDSTHGSEDYRREPIGVLGRRGLLAAAARARGEEPAWIG